MKCAPDAMILQRTDEAKIPGLVSSITRHHLICDLQGSDSVK
jgi:hypothetical protein